MKLTAHTKRWTEKTNLTTVHHGVSTIFTRASHGIKLCKSWPGTRQIRRGGKHYGHSHPCAHLIKTNCKSSDLNERPVTKPPQTRQGEAPTKSQQAYPGSDFVQLWTTAVAAAAAAGAALLLLLLHSPLRHVSRRSCRVYYCCCCVLRTDHHRR